jgi:transposase
MAHSKDLREKVLKYRKTHTLWDTKRTFDVSIETIRVWERLQKENGDVAKRPLQRSFKKIDPEQLAEYILEYPDSYLYEIAEHFNCSATAIHYALEKQHITLKKLKFSIVKQMKKNGFYSKKN